MVRHDAMSKMSNRYLSIIEEGEDAWLNGTRNPYEKDTEEWKLFEKGWHYINRLEECRADAESGMEYDEE